MTDQNSQFFAMLTAVGEAKQANADALGIAWKITQMGVGDANGTEPTPDRLQTALLNERRRAPLNQLSVDPTNASIIIAEQVIPADIGGWWIREIGLYDEDGDLVAIANCAPSFKPQLSQGSGRTQVVRMNFIVSSAANVELKIDPSVVLATRKYVDDELAKRDHKNSVRVATTANINLSGIQTIDGIALSAGNRVLVKNQNTASQNGIYVVVSGGAWTRAEDADASIEVTPGMMVPVEQGATLADTRWQLITDGAIVLGTTALTFQNVTTGFAPLASPIFTGDPKAPTPAKFDNDTSLATTGFVQSSLGSMAGSKAISISTVLTGADIGNRIEVTGTGITLTLPETAGLPDGASLLISNANRAPFIATQAGDTLGILDLGVTLPYQLPNQCDILLVKAGSSWRGYGLASVYKNFSIGASLAINGHQKLPSGLIFQWGLLLTTANSTQLVTLPVSAPSGQTAIHSGGFMTRQQASGVYAPRVNATSGSTIEIQNFSANADAVRWFVICW